MRFNIQSTMWTTTLLCTFGFFREMRPSESFVAEYFTGGWRNVTFEQVNQIIYPMGTYSHLCQLIIIFLTTDMLRYKPIIVLSGICGATMMGLLAWTYSFLGLVFLQLIYGTFMSSEVAYYTYMYAKVDKDVYEKVSGQTRSAMNLGKFLAAVIAQLLITYKLMDPRELHFISFGSQVVAVAIAILLPSVGSSLYFYARSDAKKYETDDSNKRQSSFEISVSTYDNQFEMQCGNNIESGTTAVYKQPKIKFSFVNAMKLIKQHLIAAYTNYTVICWSIWWSLATAGFLIVLSYIQLLWKSIEETSPYNGAMDAAQTLCSAIGAFGAGFLNTDRYRRWDLYILTICSLVEGLLLLWAALANSIWVAYINYVVFGAIYNFMITITSATVAKRLPPDSFALIFGINTLFALIIQAILTVIFVSGDVITLTPRGQYLAFAYYFIAFSAVYGSAEIILKIRKKFKRSK